MIPPTSTGGGLHLGRIQQEQYTIQIYEVCSPWNTLEVSVESDSELEVFILDVDRSELQNWTWNWVKDHDLPANYYRNTSALDAFLQAHPEHILLRQTMKSGVIHFTPTETISLIAVVANYSPRPTEFSFYTAKQVSLASKDRIAIPAEAFILCGGVLALPLILRRIGKESSIAARGNR